MNKNISLRENIAVLIVLLALLGILIIRFQLSPHTPILAAFMCLLFYDRSKRSTWDEIHDGITREIIPGVIPILIFLLIGVLATSWILSGAIPMIMVYGFKFVFVRFSLPTAFLVYAIVGVAVGSPFTTTSTTGTTFLGIGYLLGSNDAITAGAVVFGAFLGNSCSPLSDTTNLTAGIRGVDLFEHIVDIRYTDFSAFVLSLILYMILGHNSHSVDLVSISEMI